MNQAMYRSKCIFKRKITKNNTNLNILLLIGGYSHIWSQSIPPILMKRPNKSSISEHSVTSLQWSRNTETASGKVQLPWAPRLRTANKIYRPRLTRVIVRPHRNLYLRKVWTKSRSTECLTRAVLVRAPMTTTPPSHRRSNMQWSTTSQTLEMSGPCINFQQIKNTTPRFTSPTSTMKWTVWCFSVLTRISTPRISTRWRAG